MTWVIRERRDGDLHECAALLAQVHVEQRYPVNWPDDPGTWLTPANMAAAWVVARDDEIIGHVCLVRGNLSTSDLTLERLFVSPVAVGSGVGRALVIQASDWTAQRGAQLSLDVADNCAKAVALYRRLGWRQIGETPIDWGGDLARRLLHFEAPTG
ncbi:GNAT family N-acetyltransferase [Nocardioides sp. GCM10027113]|uniref:GNAT family N-acetyltransferase n=1 Tax=unclassified Nocardioides TaxID=2615069 RepID=UPI003620B215